MSPSASDACLREALAEGSGRPFAERFPGYSAGVPSEFRAINYVCHPDGPPAVFSNERATTATAAATAACRVSARLINSLHGARESFLLLFLFLFNAARGKKYGECARRKSLI